FCVTFVFFFQAEDGIRDFHVTGVQTCALPIYPLCDELHVVDTMHERKAMMGERADAFLALPGGIGTFEELFEVWTWRQLGYHDKPIGLLNTAGYYDNLLTFFASSVQGGFMGEWQMALIQSHADASALLPGLVETACTSTQVSALRAVI